MMPRLLLVLFSFCFIASCSVTSHSKTSDGPARTETVKTDAFSELTSAHRDLMKSVQKLSALTHQFESTDLQALFSETITQTQNTLGTDLSGVKLVIDDRSGHHKVIAGQILKSQHLLPSASLPSRISGLADASQAVYDLDTDTIFFHPDIEDRFPPSVGKSRKLAREYLRFVMLHELVHASDARSGRLKLKWPSVRAMTNAAFVREGHAHYWSTVMCRQAGCQSFIKRRAQSLNRQKNRSSANYQITGLYEVGEKFIAGLLVKDASGGLIDAAFRQPPSNEYQILFPELYPDVASDQSAQNLTSAVLAAELPWQGENFKALTTGTIDAHRFERTANRKALKNLKLLAGITVGDSAVSFINPNSGRQQNITVQVLETDTKASADKAYRSLLPLHDNARSIGDQYGVTPQPWKTSTASKTLGIRGQEIDARYFTGTNGRSLNSETSALLSVDIALVLADRFVVRILNINNNHYNLTEASESVLRKLFDQVQPVPIK